VAIYSAQYGRTEYDSIQCPQPRGIKEESELRIITLYVIIPVQPTTRQDVQNRAIFPLDFRSEEPVDPAVSALRRSIAEVKQRWSVIGWVTKNLLSQATPCFGRHVKPLVPAAFAVVSTHQPALGPRGGLWPVLLKFNS
jgi:hypothetical protein